LDVAPIDDPAEPERRQATLQIQVGGGIGVGAARVVETERGIPARERNLTHRDTDLGTGSSDVDLPGCWMRRWHTKPPFAGINQVRFMRSATVSRPLSPVPRAPAFTGSYLVCSYQRPDYDGTCRRSSRGAASPSTASSGIIANHHENLLVPPHAVPVPARRLRAEVPAGLGRRRAP